MLHCNLFRVELKANSLSEKATSPRFFCHHIIIIQLVSEKKALRVSWTQRISSLQFLSVKKRMLQRENNLCERKGLFCNIVWALALQGKKWVFAFALPERRNWSKRIWLCTAWAVLLPCLCLRHGEAWAGLGSTCNSSYWYMSTAKHTELNLEHRNLFHFKWCSVITQKPHVAYISFLISFQG